MNVTAPFFHAVTTGPQDVTRAIAADFLGTQELGMLKGAPYLKEKTIHDLRQAWRVCVKNTQGKTAGQCLLTDAANNKTSYAAVYPIRGKTLWLTSLCMHAGHMSDKGKIPPGMGPVSVLFKGTESFAMQNGYNTIIAKTNTMNQDGRKTFERMGFTPSSPFIADNEDYTSIFYVKEMTPIIGQ